MWRNVSIIFELMLVDQGSFPSMLPNVSFNTTDYQLARNSVPNDLFLLTESWIAHAHSNLTVFQKHSGSSGI